MTRQHHGPQSPDAHELAQVVLQRAPDPGLREEIDACAGAPEVRAGMHLINGDWERAHRIVQRLHTPAAAHWHALVHRHERDFPNSKYWLRKAGRRPLYERLTVAAQEMGHGELVSPGGQWDALRFTDLYAQGERHPWTTQLDALEARLLLEACLEAGSSA